ncbi:MAG TPA: hypothetical protein VGB55_14985 [Tepidisphaeraceae bacterium]|jgi:hypothetical protein
MKLHPLKTSLAAFVLLGAALAPADTLSVAGLQPRPVTFLEVTDTKIVYQTRGGDRSELELDKVASISVDGETAFNEADLAFAKNEKPKALDGYIRTLRSTNKPWLKTYTARRLLDAATGSDRFDAKLVAYLALLTTTPDAAAPFRPQLPDRGNKQLDTAVTDIENTIKLPNLPGPQQLALYNFLIEIHRQRGDEAAISSTLERIERLSGSLGDQPELRAQLAGLKVNQARIALDQKKYADAAKLVDDNRQNITNPRLQSDALYIQAQAKLATANKSDTNAMKDIALMFMRVVAHFGDLEGRPNVLPSLQATASILEQIGEKAAAVSVLEQIATEFPQDPAAGKAKQDLARLKPAS